MLRRPVAYQLQVVKSAICQICGKEVSVDFTQTEPNDEEDPIIGRCPDHPEKEPERKYGNIDGQMGIWIGWTLINEVDPKCLEPAGLIEDGDGNIDIVPVYSFRFMVELENWAPEKRID